MKQINPEWVEAVRVAVNPCPYFELQQMAVKDLSRGTSLLEIRLENRHLQPFGIVHGGVFASLIDAAGFWAVFTQADPAVGMTTVDLTIHFLAPAKDGVLIGKGKSIRLGRSLGLGEARVENEDGKLLAHGTTKVMVLPDLHLSETVRRVPKYIE
jgi:uncharacterized protein (TIGR00369 family)